ncbi:hypothetical protein XccvBFoX7_gp82 [Xanthomonas phage FoX7]|uniref:Uncharacterized protein n=2 Tax=Carpasinavirus XcP1 TaxID=2182344 RepID=A0A858NPD1_9CAUD|nr:hypothetical protein XccvBFoX6_gp82 [Xanthomonas phage FoX6]QJB22239.1 hypothetical protein XccvBFoX7_gp82 [Xanthomonas phage FoX7]
MMMGLTLRFATLLQIVCCSLRCAVVLMMN